MKPVATFSFPVKTIVGPGTLGMLSRELSQISVRKPLVVTDGGLLSTSAYGYLKEHLVAAAIPFEVFSGVHPNPVESDVDGAAAAYRTASCDGVIGFGGGSALDVAKAVRLKLKKPDLQLISFNAKDDWSCLAPCVCVPTTSGTGSEVGRTSVITIEATGHKTGIFHPCLLADLVFLDAEVTRDLPPRLTAATGIDALTHCIESFTSPVYQPYCDGIALEGVGMVVRWLPVAIDNGGDLEARTQMSVAAAMGAVAFQKDLGAAHSMAHPLSTQHGIHHGTANALCLPTVMRFNARGRPGIYRRVGEAAFLNLADLSPEDADRQTIEFLEQFIQRSGISGGLKGAGVTKDHIDRLADEAFLDACHHTNPVPVTREAFVQLFVAAL